MTAAALRRGSSEPTCARALKGNICRCTGYGSIADAIGGTARIIPNDGRPFAASARAFGAPAGPDVVTGAGPVHRRPRPRASLPTPGAMRKTCRPSRRCT